MALTSEELEEMPKAIQSAFSDLELKIIEDLVGRIKKNNEITGTGEWDISQLIRMGESKKVIKNYVAKTLKLTYSEIENIFGDVFETGYNRDNALYMAVGADFIAYRDNKPLQQYIGAVKEQTKGTYKNITNTMGFVRQRQGTKTWVPLTKYYKDTLSRAVFEITSGAFSYNQVIKRTINEMTNSGLRTIDYASGRTSRIEVAAMRAIRTAITQVTAKVFLLGGVCMKYKVTAPLGITERLYGIDFKNGIGITNNDYAVKVLKEKGYAVEELKAEKEKVSEDVH